MYSAQSAEKSGVRVGLVWMRARVWGTFCPLGLAATLPCTRSVGVSKAGEAALRNHAAFEAGCSLYRYGRGTAPAGFETMKFFARESCGSFIGDERRVETLVGDFDDGDVWRRVLRATAAACG